MFYYLEKDGKIIFYSQNRQSIIDTLKHLSDFEETDIKETEREIKDYLFVDSEEYQTKIRQELDQLTLTPADVERALYKAKGMDFDDLKALIAQSLTNVDIKAIAIEFRAKDFYRGAEANGVRLFDVIGALLGYTTADMDYLFINKQLPIKEGGNG